MSFLKPVLCFDTSLGGLSCGLEDKKSGQNYKIVVDAQRGQAEALIPIMREIMSYAHVSFKDLHSIITTKGPGAFTGLRIGLATARALKLSASCPVYGLNTMDVIAKQYFLCSKDSFQNKDSRICVVLETKRRDFYVRFYAQSGEAVTNSMVLSYDAIEEMMNPSDVIIGDGINRLGQISSIEPDRFIEGFNLIDPTAMVQMVDTNDIFKNHPEFDLSPVYLRGADISKSKKTHRNLAEK